MEKNSLITFIEQGKANSEEGLKIFLTRLTGYIASVLTPQIEAEILKILKLPEDFLKDEQ